MHILYGDYELGNLVGSGSFGQVYQCWDTHTGREFAVKKFKKKFATRKQAYDMREVRVLLKFDYFHKNGQHCPYVMRAERLEYDNKRLFIVFERMDMNLSDYIKKKRHLSPNDRADINTIMKQITIGLKYLHEDLGVMHRDLKPENIMINENPLIAKIIDFGTAKDMQVEQGPHTSYVSTRWYRAPECILRSHNYHPV